MTKSEARAKLNKVLAKQSLPQFFYLIEKEIEKGNDCLTLTVKDITEDQIRSLRDDYRYIIQYNDDNQGNGIDRVSKTISYTIRW